jgi:hypothetical protein
MVCKDFFKHSDERLGDSLCRASEESDTSNTSDPAKSSGRDQKRSEWTKTCCSGRVPTRNNLYHKSSRATMYIVSGSMGCVTKKAPTGEHGDSVCLGHYEQARAVAALPTANDE